MIVSCKQRPTVIDLVDVFQGGPGNRQPIKCRGAAPNLVEDNQRTIRRLIKNGRGFHHLNHKSRPAPGQIIRRPDAAKHPVNDANMGRLRGNEGAHLRQNGNQSILSQKSTFPRHIRARQQPQSICRREIAIIRHKSTRTGIAQRFLHNGVPAA